MLKRFFVVAALGLSAVACGNECDDAEDKIEECGIPTEGSSEEAEECNEQAECAAKCINDASCEEIKAFYTDFADNSFSQCVVKCG